MVRTLLICWSEDPQAIEASQPQHYERLIAATRERFPDLPLRLGR